MLSILKPVRPSCFRLRFRYRYYFLYWQSYELCLSFLQGKSLTSALSAEKHLASLPISSPTAGNIQASNHFPVPNVDGPSRERWTCGDTQRHSTLKVGPPLTDPTPILRPKTSGLTQIFPGLMAKH